jgi:hypothetical protein
MARKLLSIGQASQLTGLSIPALRNLEKSGKLVSTRSAKGTRRYSLTDIKSYLNHEYSADLKILSEIKQIEATEDVIKTISNQTSDLVIAGPTSSVKPVWQIMMLLVLGIIVVFQFSLLFYLLKPTQDQVLGIKSDNPFNLIDQKMLEIKNKLMPR